MIRQWVCQTVAPTITFVLLFAFCVASFASDEFAFDFSGKISLENRWFSQPGIYPNQARKANGFVIEPEFYIEHETGWSFSLSPFFRYDHSDSNRSHADLRDAYFLNYGQGEASEWEIRLGIDRVFWGVAETINLVDIVNQSDVLEDPLGKTKLGQSMAYFTLSGDWGIAEFAVLPHHRQRKYPGPKGRLRSQLIVDTSKSTYESKSKQRHIDYAFRYSQTIGVADVGISYFDGTSKEPSLRPVVNNDGSAVLVPHYEQIRQTGLETQIALAEILFKLEAIRRENAVNLRFKEDDYSAFVVGGEYTFYSAFGTDADITLLAERIKDSRGINATNSLQNEIFLATRVSLNDVQGTQLTASTISDREYESKTLNFEFKRRLSSEWNFELEATHILEADPNDPHQYPIRNDDFVDLRLIYHF